MRFALSLIKNYNNMVSKLKRSFYLLSFLTLALLSSCSVDPCGNNTGGFLKNFEEFVSEVEDQELEYEDDKWEDLDIRFQRYTKECYENFEDDMDNDDKGELYATVSRYYISKYGNGILSQLKNDNLEIWNEFKRNIKENVEIEGEGFEEFLLSLEESIDKEKVKNFLDKIGDTLKEIAEDIEIE